MFNFRGVVIPVVSLAKKIRRISWNDIKLVAFVVDRLTEAIRIKKSRIRDIIW